jgi:hypothetical protein
MDDPRPKTEAAPRRRQVMRYPTRVYQNDLPSFRLHLSFTVCTSSYKKNEPTSPTLDRFTTYQMGLSTELPDGSPKILQKQDLFM